MAAWFGRHGMPPPAPNPDHLTLKLVCELHLRWDTAVPAAGNGDLQTLICVLVERPRRCPTLSNPVPWQNWHLAAYLGYTLQIKTLFLGWPVMIHGMHMRRRRSKVGNLPSKFGHARPLGSQILHYVHDGQTDRQTDRSNIYCPFPKVGGISKRRNKLWCLQKLLEVEADSKKLLKWHQYHKFRSNPITTRCKPESPAGAISLSFRDAVFTRFNVEVREPDSDAKPRRQTILLADSFTGHLPSVTVCCFTTAPAADANEGENKVNRIAYMSNRRWLQWSLDLNTEKCTYIISQKQ